jgi:alpha-beta hydrolase superfamily lysophospholipase
MISVPMACGIESIRTNLHEGRRHEILKEINRDKVHSEVCTWIDSHQDVNEH